jgi:predicted dienelactone hydrolase
MLKRISFVLMSVLLVISILPLAVTAQEGDEPQATGLRPDAPAYGVHGPYPVGTMEFVIEDTRHPLPITLWYPALNPDGAEEIVSYAVDLGEGLPPVTVNGHALLDAEPDFAAGPFPLVIFSHGNAMFRTEAVYLTEHLASYGFAVIAVNHTGTAAPDAWPNAPEAYRPNDIVGMIHRPLDITSVIDYAAMLAADDGVLSGLIDTERVAHMGWSYGGYVTLAAGGAQLDYDAFEAWCAETTTWGPHEHQMCYLVGHNEELVEIAGLDTVPSGLWPSLGDPRIDALVGFSPGRIPAFGTDGLASLTLPMMVFVGSNDTDSPPERYVYPMYERVGSAQKILAVFEGADHYIFAGDCSATPWMVDFGLYGICSDAVWDMDRAHDLINHLTTAFLLAELYGDEDATAALSAEAVQFPGVNYETTGY